MKLCTFFLEIQKWVLYNIKAELMSGILFCEHTNIINPTKCASGFIYDNSSSIFSIYLCIHFILGAALITIHTFSHSINKFIPINLLKSPFSFRKPAEFLFILLFHSSAYFSGITSSLTGVGISIYYLLEYFLLYPLLDKKINQFYILSLNFFFSCVVGFQVHTYLAPTDANFAPTMLIIGAMFIAIQVQLDKFMINRLHYQDLKLHQEQPIKTANTLKEIALLVLEIKQENETLLMGILEFHQKECTDFYCPCQFKIKKRKEDTIQVRQFQTEKRIQQEQSGLLLNSYKNSQEIVQARKDLYEDSSVGERQMIQVKDNQNVNNVNQKKNDSSGSYQTNNQGSLSLTIFKLDQKQSQQEQLKEKQEKYEGENNKIKKTLFKMAPSSNLQDNESNKQLTFSQLSAKPLSFSQIPNKKSAIVNFTSKKSVSKLLKTQQNSGNNESTTAKISSVNQNYLLQKSLTGMNKVINEEDEFERIDISIMSSDKMSYRKWVLDFVDYHYDKILRYQYLKRNFSLLIQIGIQFLFFQIEIKGNLIKALFFVRKWASQIQKKNFYFSVIEQPISDLIENKIKDGDKTLKYSLKRKDKEEAEILESYESFIVLEELLKIYNTKLKYVIEIKLLHYQNLSKGFIFLFYILNLLIELGFNSLRTLFQSGESILTKGKLLERKVLQNLYEQKNRSPHLFRLLFTFYLVIYQDVRKSILCDAKFKELIGEVNSNNSNQIQKYISKYTLTCDSMITGNVATIIAHFKQKFGKIVKYSASAPGFFGYSRQEFQELPTLNALMPHSISLKHDMFIQRLIEDGKSKVLRAYRNVFAKNKLGYVFEATLFLNYFFELRENLLFSAFLIKRKQVSNLIIISPQGFIEGVSQTFMQFCQLVCNEMKLSDLIGSNIMILIPDMLNMLKENFDGKSFNQNFNQIKTKMNLSSESQKLLQKFKILWKRDKRFCKLMIDLAIIQQEAEQITSEDSLFEFELSLNITLESFELIIGKPLELFIVEIIKITPSKKLQKQCIQEEKQDLINLQKQLELDLLSDNSLDCVNEDNFVVLKKSNQKQLNSIDNTSNKIEEFYNEFINNNNNTNNKMNQSSFQFIKSQIDVYDQKQTQYQQNVEEISFCENMNEFQNINQNEQQSQNKKSPIIDRNLHLMNSTSLQSKFAPSTHSQSPSQFDLRSRSSSVPFKPIQAKQNNNNIKDDSNINLKLQDVNDNNMNQKQLIQNNFSWSLINPSSTNAQSNQQSYIIQAGNNFRDSSYLNNTNDGSRQYLNPHNNNSNNNNNNIHNHMNQSLLISPTSRLHELELELSNLPSQRVNQELLQKESDYSIEQSYSMRNKYNNPILQRNQQQFVLNSPLHMSSGMIFSPLNSQAINFPLLDNSHLQGTQQLIPSTRRHLNNQEEQQQPEYDKDNNHHNIDSFHEQIYQNCNNDYMINYIQAEPHDEYNYAGNSQNKEKEEDLNSKSKRESSLMISSIQPSKRQFHNLKAVNSVDLDNQSEKFKYLSSKPNQGKLFKSRSKLRKNTKLKVVKGIQNLIERNNIIDFNCNLSDSSDDQNDQSIQFKQLSFINQQTFKKISYERQVDSLSLKNQASKSRSVQASQISGDVNSIQNKIQRLYNIVSSIPLPQHLFFVFPIILALIAISLIAILTSVLIIDHKIYQAFSKITLLEIEQHFSFTASQCLLSQLDSFYPSFENQEKYYFDYIQKNGEGKIIEVLKLLEFSDIEEFLQVEQQNVLQFSSNQISVRDGLSIMLSSVLDCENDNDDYFLIRQSGLYAFQLQSALHDLSQQSIDSASQLIQESIEFNEYLLALVLFVQVVSGIFLLLIESKCRKYITHFLFVTTRITPIDGQNEILKLQSVLENLKSSDDAYLKFSFLTEGSSRRIVQQQQSSSQQSRVKERQFLFNKVKRQSYGMTFLTFIILFSLLFGIIHTIIVRIILRMIKDNNVFMLEKSQAHSVQEPFEIGKTFLLNLGSLSMLAFSSSVVNNNEPGAEEAKQYMEKNLSFLSHYYLEEYQNIPFLCPSCYFSEILQSSNESNTCSLYEDDENNVSFCKLTQLPLGLLSSIRTFFAYMNTKTESQNQIAVFSLLLDCLDIVSDIVQESPKIALSSSVTFVLIARLIGFGGLLVLYGIITYLFKNTVKNDLNSAKQFIRLLPKKQLAEENSTLQLIVNKIN